MLESVRLAREGTFCHDSMTQVERAWLRESQGSCDSLLRYHNLGRSEENWGSKKRLNPPLCIVLGMDPTTLEAYTAYLAGHAKVRRCR